MGQAGDTAKGAAAGAMAGSAFGPWGTAIGGVAGGIYGYATSPSDSGSGTLAKQPQNADWMRTHLKTSTDQYAPSVGDVSTWQTNQTRGQQGRLADMLFQTANGTQPGAGEMAVRRNIGSAMAQQTSAAQMARGANSALAMRNAARQNAAIGVDGAGQAAIAQLNDRSAAQNQLTGLLGMTRGQDLGQRGQDIGIAQGNQQAQLAQQQQNLQALQQLLAVDQAALGQGNAQASLDLAEKQRRDAQMASLMQQGGQIGMAFANRTPAPTAPVSPYTPTGGLNYDYRG